MSEEGSVCAGHPLIAPPFDVMATVPDGTGGPAGATVTVSVTESPTVEGLRLEVTDVVEASRTISVKAPLLDV